MNFKKILRIIPIAAATLWLTACSDDESAPRVNVAGTTVTAPASSPKPVGVYVLNEGAMGTNKASIDYFDYSLGKFYLNLFPAVNPQVTLGLGDTGNDIQVYRDKVYAVINGSNLVEVMSASGLRHLAAIQMASPRSIAFGGGYAYVSSYAGANYGDKKDVKGSVYKVSLKTMSVVDTAEVGCQPEGVVYSGGRLFVANSGGYLYPNYEKTVSVVNAQTMSVEKTIECGLNPGKMALAADGKLYVVSTGNYYDVSSSVSVIDTKTATMTGKIDARVSSIAVDADYLYIIGVEYKAPTYEATVSYSRYDLKAGKLAGSFISDGTDKTVTAPYAVAVNPNTREIFVADAKDYKQPGELRCYSSDGKLQWKATTGIIPGHIAFATTKLRGLE